MRACAQSHTNAWLRDYRRDAVRTNVVVFAVTEAIRLGAIGFNAFKQITLARIELRPVRLNLAAYHWD